MYCRLSRSSASERKWKARGTVDKMTSPELGYAMLGFSSASNFNADMKILARVVTRHVWNMDSAVSARDMSRALYGLQGFSDNCVETHDLLCALNRAFRLENPQFAGGPSVASDSFRDCSTSQGTIDRQMTTRELSSGVYGLKQLSDEDPAVQELLKILSDQLDGLINSSSETTFTARETAMIMQGVRSMMFQSDSARRFIGRLSVVLGRAPAVDNEVYALSGLNLANAINGMKNMSSGIVEVCQLITVLQRRIPQATSLTTVNIPTIRDITAAYFGLRNMHSDSAEVKCLLAALNRSYLNLEHLDLSIDTRCMGNILYGLRFMQDDEPEVRKLLLWLTRQMKARIVEGGTFSENRPLAYAFHGLRNMSCNFQEVRDLLDLLNGQLEHHLLSARPPMQTWEVVLAFNGLQYKSATLDGEESLLQRTCIILAEALARSEKLERLSPSYICSIMASLNVLSSEYRCVHIFCIYNTKQYPLRFFFACKQRSQFYSATAGVFNARACQMRTK